jgi:hypothetical protein
MIKICKLETTQTDFSAALQAKLAYEELQDENR